jgi:uncharacterized protein DUF6524
MWLIPWGGGAKPRGHGHMWLVGKLAARLLFAAFLVFASYNPAGRSYFHMIRDASIDGLWKIIAGGLLLVAYGIVVPVTWRALGFGGIVMTTGLATTTIWVMIQAGWISLSSSDDALTWITLSVLAFVLGVGSSWMLIGRTLDGQLRTRDITR